MLRTLGFSPLFCVMLGRIIREAVYSMLQLSQGAMQLMPQQTKLGRVQAVPILMHSGVYDTFSAPPARGRSEYNLVVNSASPLALTLVKARSFLSGKLRTIWLNRRQQIFK